MVPQQFYNAQNNIIKVAESRCLRLFRVVEATRPVDGNVAFFAVKPRGALHRATATDAAKFKQTIENRTVVTDIEFDLFLGKQVGVFRRHARQKVNVLVRMELAHFLFRSRFRALKKN